MSRARVHLQRRVVQFSPTSALSLSTERGESEAFEEASERSGNACFDAVDSNQKRKRMGIEPTKRLFGRFTSFED